MKLKTPIRLAPKETKGLYAHSACRGDEQIVYDNQRHHVSLSDMHLDILPGQAHLSDVPFSSHGQFQGWWGPPWRDRREFVGRLSYGIRWLRWNPNVHEQMPPLFRSLVWSVVMSRHKRANQSLLYWLTDDHILYILNSIDWWDAPHVQEDLDRLLHPPLPSVTAQMTAAGAAAGKVVSAKSKSVFKRLAASMTNWARRRRNEAEIEASDAGSPASSAVSSAVNGASGGAAASAENGASFTENGASSNANSDASTNVDTLTPSPSRSIGGSGAAFGLLAAASTMAGGYGV